MRKRTKEECEKNRPTDEEDGQRHFWNDIKRVDHQNVRLTMYVIDRNVWMADLGTGNRLERFERQWPGRRKQSMSRQLPSNDKQNNDASLDGRK